jgi:cell division protein FtsB
MKYKILGIALAILIGVPAVTSASSFVVSLIQGKTPAEAVEILAGQIDTLLGRVEVLENAQIETEQDVADIRTGQERVSQTVSEVKIQQVQDSEKIKQTELEIEKLRLENENLKLQAENIKTQAKDIKSKQACESLAKKMPDKRGYDNWGPTPTIVELYQRAKMLWDGGLSWESEENKVLVKAVYDEAKPLYEAYIAKCQ